MLPGVVGNTRAIRPAVPVTPGQAAIATGAVIAEAAIALEIFSPTIDISLHPTIEDTLDVALEYVWPNDPAIDDSDEYTLEPPDTSGPPRCLCFKYFPSLVGEPFTFLGYLEVSTCYSHGGFCAEDLFDGKVKEGPMDRPLW
jgi:hypothetical protein